MVSLESMAELLPDGEDSDKFMLEHYDRVSQLCAQVHVDEDKFKPRWNKTYGEGGTCWYGELDDGRLRGGMPYVCPSGWVRFSLDVGKDADFEKKFDGWGYLYHGTKGKFVGAILTSGLRASRGLCYCGSGDHAVYMSPSIEYCGHPRYSRIEFNPENKHWVQVVLQCRVKPEAVWQKGAETMRCEEFGIEVDPNFPNNSIEWLFRPNSKDPITQHMFLKDAIVCTGIMVRVTKRHPNDLDYWWSKDREYLRRWGLLATQVDPLQSARLGANWLWFPEAMGVAFTLRALGDADFSMDSMDPEHWGTVWKAPVPFANGSMRFAYYLHTPRGMFVAKEYNEETKRHIEDALNTTVQEMMIRDIKTYLVAAHYAQKFNLTTVTSWNVSFVQPVLLVLGNEIVFAEPMVEGKFLKWNNNDGGVNTSPQASLGYMNRVAETYSHFTYSASKGKLMIVDVQGWDVGQILFTDPQIHTRSYRSGSAGRRADGMFCQYSVGNFGKVGMVKFFMSHKCNKTCRDLSLVHPVHGKKRCLVPDA